MTYSQGVLMKGAEDFCPSTGIYCQWTSNHAIAPVSPTLWLSKAKSDGGMEGTLDIKQVNTDVALKPKFKTMRDNWRTHQR
jgi:hypothetical protein